MAAKKKQARKATAKSVKSLAKRTEKSNAKLKKTDIKIKKELSTLQKELAKLKKNPKSKKRELNEYNLFMRKQLRSGKNFRQAVAAWNRFKKLQNKRKPSAYNSFIASQLKQGKSFKDSVALWKRLKSGKAAKTKTVTKIKRVFIKAKPKIVYRTRIVEKPVAAKRLAFEKQPVILPDKIIEVLEQRIKKNPSHGLPLEEIAYRMLSIYFEELARTGMKRSLSLSELVDSYHHALEKIKQKIPGFEKSLVHEEEIAFRIVKLYFFELARFGKKRTTTLDDLLEAYFFVLDRIAPASKTA